MRKPGPGKDHVNKKLFIYLFTRNILDNTGSLNSPVGIVTRLRAGRPRNLGSIAGAHARGFVLSEVSRPALKLIYFMINEAYLKEEKCVGDVGLTAHILLMLCLKMREAVRHVPSLRTPGLHLHLYVGENAISPLREQTG